MDTGKRSRRSSADSRLSAILKPLSTYEPLSPEALEQARKDAIERQTELPSWSRTPSRKTGKNRPSSAHRNSQLSTLSQCESYDIQRARSDAAYGLVPRHSNVTDLPTLPQGIEIDGDGDEDGASLLQTPTHRSTRRSHRLSRQSTKSQKPYDYTPRRNRFSDQFDRAPSRITRQRSPQFISALPPMPPGTASSEITNWEKLQKEILSNEKLAPPVPPKAPNRNTLTGPPPPPPVDPDIVRWDGPHDPENPQNWSKSKKWTCTIALGLVTFCVTFASSVFSAGTVPAARYYGTSNEVMVLGTAIFVLGLGCGPVIFGPCSELYGRKLPLVVGFVVFAIFQIPVALAENVATLFACRFISGFAGGAPLTIVGGALADFWDPVSRGVAVSVFACATFLGPTSGPIIGGYLTQNSHLGFRWNSWITLLFSVVFGLFFVYAYPESFGPVILSRRAKKLRFVTRNFALHSPAEEVEVDLKVILSKYLSKPFVMLAMEPILLLVTIYISFIYGILYLFFVSYQISFIEQRGWSLGMGGLPFIAVMVGVVLGGVVNLAFTKLRFAKIMKQSGRLPPEERLLPMAVGGVSLPAGLFWWAWTSSPQISPWPQMLAGVPAGMGIVLIFLQGLNYLIDVYLMHANSAIAGNTFIRSIVGAIFPMIAHYMYRDLGVQWATTCLAFISLALMPVPLLFFAYGARIRKMSRFVPKLPPGMGPGGSSGGGPPPGAPPSAESGSPPLQEVPIVISEKV